MPHCCSEVRRPTKSPRRFTSTVPICSTTRVAVPSMTISSLKEALLALLDVGVIRTVEREEGV